MCAKKRAKAGEEWKDKYTARVWQMNSPEGGYQALLTLDTAVSIAWMESRFPGWKCRAYFKHEHDIALGKAQRYLDKMEDDGNDGSGF